MKNKSQAEDREAMAHAASARFFRVLGNPTRLVILQHLLMREHSVSELTAKLGMTQSRISNHLACLRWCRFVTTKRVGRNVVYSISDHRLQELLRVAGEISGENRDHLASCQRIGPDWI